MLGLVVNLLPALLLILPTATTAAPQTGQTTIPPEGIREMIGRYRLDDRGPYRAILWYCPDGTTRPAQSRCDTPGGIQHAAPKEEVTRLAETNHVFLGQILAGTANDAFLDAGNRFSRAKQYLLERFLQNVDDGWIFAKSQFYRGAVQAEDEEAWSESFLTWLLGDDQFIAEHFLLARDLVRTLPRAGNQDVLQRIRAGARLIAEEYPAFSSLRIKIHGQPDPTDRTQVQSFFNRHRSALSGELTDRFASLLADMDTVYGVSEAERLLLIVERLPRSHTLRDPVREYLASSASLTDRRKSRALSDMLTPLRSEIQNTPSARTRLVLLDVMQELEYQLVRSASAWQPQTIGDLLEKNYLLARATSASGYIEEWEWQAIEPQMRVGDLSSAFTAAALEDKLLLARRMVEWGIGRVEATYGETVDRFAAFEPLALGYTDDRLRSSLLLALGGAADQAGSAVVAVSGRENDIMKLEGAGRARGLNPGVAVGVLQVITGPAEETDFQSDRIYVLSRAPAELKPVAGIATVSEGNVVSHVQLLARNLGIPNAVVTPELLRALVAYDGQPVFYAVSPKGALRLKPAAEMTAEERALVEERIRSEERIHVPIDRMDLASTELNSLYDLRASDSGRLCGPKAANLGQLSSLFPGRVAPGFIIPFSVFRNHMDQAMPGYEGSYWEYLTKTFADAARDRTEGHSEPEIDARVLERLALLRQGIESMALSTDFVEAVRGRFPEIFGRSIGSMPVFIRSDTNMEDLKDFTGAGLNLTVPNVVAESDILQAIRRVWASPYRERGYRWRQKYLLNPEDVYPSILVLASVDVDKSGVLITTGIASGNPDDVTIAFNHGVGGAVDGQAAETYLLRPGGGHELLAPAREPSFRTLPSKGGTATQYADFSEGITSPEEREILLSLAHDVRRILPGTQGIESAGPFDMELGFLGDQLWLFQVRPFVENRNAGATQYLQAMDAASNATRRFTLNQRLSGL